MGAMRLKPLEDGMKVNLAGAELDHHIPFARTTIFGAKAGTVGRNRIDLGNRIFAGD
jgi:hypothetical protein